MSDDVAVKPQGWKSEKFDRLTNDKSGRGRPHRQATSSPARPTRSCGYPAPRSACSSGVMTSSFYRGPVLTTGDVQYVEFSARIINHGQRPWY